MKKGRGLLNYMPELKTEEEITWKETEIGENFRQLCELLKENAIPTKTLHFWCTKISEARKWNNESELKVLKLNRD